MVNLKVNYDEYIPLRDIVFKTLREAIITGDLKPGERLMEIKLANELGVSRTPAREAIRKLELEGLVLMIPRKGAVVAEITEKSLRDVLEVRGSLEELAVELACERITQEQIEELKEIYSDPIAYVENTLKESREAYEKCVADMEELLAKQDRLEHKAYARGRRDAYAEMGIKALDARLNGETLYVDENDNDGQVVNCEHTEGEDMDEETFTIFCEGNEIDISDLTRENENGSI